MLRSDDRKARDASWPSPEQHKRATNPRSDLNCAAEGMRDFRAQARELLLDDLLGRWQHVLTGEDTALEESTDATVGWMNMNQINSQDYQPAVGMPLGTYVQRMGIGDQVAGAADESVEVVLADLAARTLVFFRQTMPVGNPLLKQPEWLRRRQQRLAQLGAGPRRPAALLSAYLRAEQGLGRVRRDADPDAAAALLLGACFHAAFLTAFLDDMPQDESRFARAIARLLMVGVKQTEQPPLTRTEGNRSED